MPKNDLTVLGEFHKNRKGTYTDVILGLGTSRFMAERLNEMESLKALPLKGKSTTGRLANIQAGDRLSGAIDPKKKFTPALENIVLKAMAGSALFRNEFLAQHPWSMKHPKRAAVLKRWSGRPSTSDYSRGERTALYFSMAIHVAQDVSKHAFDPWDAKEPKVVTFGRRLKTFYLANAKVLDALMTAKDRDVLIGIYELVAANKFKDLKVLKDFSVVFHNYAADYIVQLGVEKGQAGLAKEGKVLAKAGGAKLSAFSPAREEIMWAKVLDAKARGYLIVGMGDAHRTNLAPRLAKEKIAHEEVTASLARQKAAVNSKWVT